MIGLANPQSQSRITIDYSDKSLAGWSKTYLQCTKACIQEDKSLCILSILFIRLKRLSLPSRCPNISANQKRQVVFSERSNAGILKSIREETELPRAWVEEEDDILFAPGCRVDLVQKIFSSTFLCGVDGSNSEVWKPMGVHNLAWENECYGLTQRKVKAGAEADIIYIQTPIENNPTLGKQRHGSTSNIG